MSKTAILKQVVYHIFIQIILNSYTFQKSNVFRE